jgi:S-formylglutathione hydrolase
MESYLTQELPAALAAGFPVQPEHCGLFGHSMGGHGALTLALRHPGRWRSVSAFAPIAAPTRSPWGTKAFAGYLGEDRTAWPHTTRAR